MRWNTDDVVFLRARERSTVESSRCSQQQSTIRGIFSGRVSVCESKKIVSCFAYNTRSQT